jgi:hypothetical protein
MLGHYFWYNGSVLGILSDNCHDLSQVIIFIFVWAVVTRDTDQRTYH